MKTISRLILITSVLMSACDNKDDIDSFLKIDVAEFNQKIITGRQENQQWVETPYLIVNQLFGPSYNSEGHQTFILEQYENDTENSLTVIVTQGGLLDDSVAGEKRIIEFKFENEAWTITKMTLGMKCYEYRGGHTNYSGDICS